MKRIPVVALCAALSLGAVSEGVAVAQSLGSEQSGNVMVMAKQKSSNSDKTTLKEWAKNPHKGKKADKFGSSGDVKLKYSKKATRESGFSYLEHTFLKGDSVGCMTYPIDEETGSAVIPMRHTVRDLGNKNNKKMKAEVKVFKANGEELSKSEWEFPDRWMNGFMIATEGNLEIYKEGTYWVAVKYVLPGYEDFDIVQKVIVV